MFKHRTILNSTLLYIHDIMPQIFLMGNNWNVHKKEVVCLLSERLSNALVDPCISMKSVVSEENRQAAQKHGYITLYALVKSLDSY